MPTTLSTRTTIDEMQQIPLEIFEATGDMHRTETTKQQSQEKDKETTRLCSWDMGRRSSCYNVYDAIPVGTVRSIFQGGTIVAAAGGGLSGGRGECEHAKHVWSDMSVLGLLEGISIGSAVIVGLWS